jgi:S-adenosylmethionine hydrolase
VVHAVLLRQAPTARVVDLTHLIPPHDVRAGALTLWRAAPWLVPGVILGVVDPGVGTERPAVAIEVASAGAMLVGPDNGLLLPAALRLGSVTAAVELSPPPTPPPGATFAGRDIFAPAAGRLAAGAPLLELGRPVDPASLRGEPVPEPKVTAHEVDAEVLWVDRFGNAQLNATPADTGPGPVQLDAGRGPRTVRIVASYGAIAADDIALVVDSYGLLSICADRRSAADLLGLASGTPIRLARTSTDGR